jgi:hypothetical protein
VIAPDRPDRHGRTPCPACHSTIRFVGGACARAGCERFGIGPPAGGPAPERPPSGLEWLLLDPYAAWQRAADEACARLVAAPDLHAQDAELLLLKLLIRERTAFPGAHLPTGLAAARPVLEARGLIEPDAPKPTQEGP